MSRVVCACYGFYTMEFEGLSVDEALERATLNGPYSPGDWEDADFTCKCFEAPAPTNGSEASVTGGDACEDTETEELLEKLRERGLAVFVADTRSGCYRARYSTDETGELTGAMLDFIHKIITGEVGQSEE